MWENATVLSLGGLSLVLLLQQSLANLSLLFYVSLSHTHKQNGAGLHKYEGKMVSGGTRFCKL